MVRDYNDSVFMGSELIEQEKISCLYLLQHCPSPIDSSSARILWQAYTNP